MANGGKGPTKLRNEHKYKGIEKVQATKNAKKLFDHKHAFERQVLILIDQVGMER